MPLNALYSLYQRTTAPDHTLRQLFLLGFLHNLHPAGQQTSLQKTGAGHLVTGHRLPFDLAAMVYSLGEVPCMMLRSIYKAHVIIIHVVCCS